MNFLKKIGNFCTFGTIDRHGAKKIKNQADEYLSNAKEELEDKRNKTEKSIEKLGDVKLFAYSSSLEKFYNCYIQISKADRKSFRCSTDTVSYKDVKHSLITIYKTKISLKKIALQSAGAISTGALVATGTYFAVKGLVFGKLAGVAAKNATLAWLGGGSCASGGAGMAGGKVVLGGIALAPVALFSMYMGYSAGKRKLNDAKNYADEVEVFVQKVKTLICELNQIDRATKLFTKTIVSMNEVLLVQTEKLETVINRLNSRTFFQKVIRDPIKKFFHKNIFDSDELRLITDALNSAVLLSSLIERPLMNDDGAFISSSLDFIESANKKAETYKKLLKA